MEINVKRVNGIAVVEFDGAIDGRSAPEVQRRLSPLLKPRSSLILDMAGVGYMSSAGLRLLVVAHRDVSEGDGVLVLAGLSERVRDTMSITGFLPFFTIYGTVEEALSALK
jgi:anti-sigma B factor antagonist